jgi:hypothetical protein
MNLGLLMATIIGLIAFVVLLNILHGLIALLVFNMPCTYRSLVLVKSCETSLGSLRIISTLIFINFVLLLNRMSYNLSTYQLYLQLIGRIIGFRYIDLMIILSRPLIQMDRFGWRFELRCYDLIRMQSNRIIISILLSRLHLLHLELI